MPPKSWRRNSGALLPNVSPQQVSPSGGVLSSKLGVDPHKLIELIQASMVRSGVVDYKAPFVLRRDYSPNFPLRLMHKDIHLMLDTAKEVRVQ